ncbi:hypothetical protein DID88_002304 [Monilinia fructigena]|uniref:Uncharacterized protein n=1 Tax=Monilinia fructigena TaxID=38457 RepID=A0A395IDF2_9HELO|nr:hypothetical protein DID88_002304 [Monilinia fructigena]
MHLNQVLSGLESQAQPSTQGSNTHNSLATFQDHHVLLALTRYHLGQTYMEQDRYDHARDKFKEALEVNPAGRPGGSELYYSITLALCKSYLERDKFDRKEATKLAVSVIVANQTKMVGSGLDWHLLIEAHLSLARALREAGGTKDIDDAMRICEYIQNLAKDKRLFGEGNNSDEADLASFQAYLYEDKKDYKAAKKLRGSVRDIVSKLEGSTSLSYFKCSNALAKTLQRNGDFLKAADKHDEAKKEFENAIAEFSAVVKGFKEILGEYATRTLRTCQTLVIDLAETCAALGGPDYEELAEKYYTQALTALKDCVDDDMKNNFFRVKLKMGDLFRQQKKFEQAQKLIWEACQYFCNSESNELNEDNVDDDNTVKRHDSVEQWEAILRWAELVLNPQQHKIEWEKSEDNLINFEDNPVKLVRKAKRGLENATSASHPLTLQAAVLLDNENEVDEYEDDMGSLFSDEEDLDLRGEKRVPEGVEQQCNIPQEYFDMLHNAQPVMEQPRNPEFQVPQQDQIYAPTSIPAGKL